MHARRTKARIGSLLLVAVGAGLAALLISPGFAAPAQRVGASVWSGLDASHPDDLRLGADTLKGVEVGAPVYHLATGHERAPVAHVLRTETDAAGASVVHLRFEPGFDPRGPWTLRVFPPRRGLGDSIRLAVPRETARRLGGAMRKRLDSLWREELGPALAARLPAFLDRIDPRHAGRSKELLTNFGDDAMERLRPLMNDLLDTITRALRKELDFMDRMGVLWKFVRGDGKGIQRKVQPLAEHAARTWWTEHQAEVVAALGETFEERLPDIREWLETDVLEAARQELLEPILDAHRERLEKEGESLVRLAMGEIVESDEGGFRVRFAAMLRMTLLGKRRALLLIERPGAGAPARDGR